MVVSRVTQTLDGAGEVVRVNPPAPRILILTLVFGACIFFGPRHHFFITA
jgi:hypothetical protein